MGVFKRPAKAKKGQKEHWESTLDFLGLVILD